MSIQINETAQLNIVIRNVIATDEELTKFRTGLSNEFGVIHDLEISFEHATKQGLHHTIRFCIPGPLQFQDNRLMDVLYAIPLVKWSIHYQSGPKGQASIL